MTKQLSVGDVRPSSYCTLAHRLHLHLARVCTAWIWWRFLIKLEDGRNPSQARCSLEVILVHGIHSQATVTLCIGLGACFSLNLAPFSFGYLLLVPNLAVKALLESQAQFEMSNRGRKNVALLYKMIFFSIVSIMCNFWLSCHRGFYFSWNTAQFYLRRSLKMIRL